MEQAQHGICGYCSARIHTSPPQLDHFRPKAAVTRAIDSPGEELDGSDRLNPSRPRRLLPKPPLRPGYWWLAYDWTNYVACCERCNTAWKRTLFMVQCDGRRAGEHAAPQRGVPERALLLNPFEVTDPPDHLRFDEAGAVVALTCEGQATMDTCALDRPSLRRARHDRLRLIGVLADDLNRAGMPREVSDRKRAVLRGEGDWDKPFASAVRSVAAGRGILWPHLDRGSASAEVADEPEGQR